MSVITKNDSHRRVAFNTQDLSKPAFAAYCSSSYVMYQVGTDYYAAENEAATELHYVGDVFDVNDFFEELVLEKQEENIRNVL